MSMFRSSGALLSLVFCLSLTNTVVSSATPAGANEGPPFNCKHLEGVWASETFSPNLNVTNRHRAEYSSDGTVTLDFEIVHADGGTQKLPRVVRRWLCDGYIYVTQGDSEKEVHKGDTEPRIKVYQLLYLSPNEIRYVTVIGHSPGLEFKLSR